MTAASERYHALDALRGYAMFLGVLLHAALPYPEHPVPFWPVQDSRRSSVFDFLLLAVHDFRMQLFFLLAGFFGCLLYTRNGTIGTAKHRLRRVASPLLLAFLALQLPMQAISVYAAADALAVNPDDPNHKKFAEYLQVGNGPWDAVVHHFSSGNFLHFLIPAHLWFLWYLLIFFALMLPLAWFADRLRPRALGRVWDKGPRWLFQSRWRWLVLAAATWPLLAMMQSPFGPDTPFDWLPPIQLVTYYFLFFLVGWTLYRQRDLLPQFADGWGLWLALGHLLVFPLALGCLYFWMTPESLELSDGRPAGWLAMLAMALFTWMTIGGLIGLFLRYLSRERKTIRWLADSSYWCYLMSLPPIMLLQYLAVDWNVNAIAKFTAVTVITMALLLLSYRYLVRYTWIGRLLNGPRTRPNREFKAKIPATV